LLADRYYLTSWALASFLTFHCKVLNGKNLDAYAQDTFRKTDPVQAFGTMVGRDPKQLMEFEQEFRFYVGHLRPNGTVAEPK
jgi:hypothetical protein